MNKIITLFFLAITFISNAQDTTFVQTFTYDSISTRRATFDFPQELEGKRFEKVLMYYNLICDPATPWDNYNCGEWDYLAYTRIFDHTGVMDSVQVDGKAFLMNFASPATQNYDLVGAYIDNNKQNYEQKKRSGAALTNNSVISGIDNSVYPFNQGATGGQHYQMIITAAELTTAGITAGDLQSLVLEGVAPNGAADLTGATIKYAFTTDTEITDWTTTGLTEVYNAKRGQDVNDDAILNNGANEFLFYQPIPWNGLDNIILDFQHANASQQNLEFNTTGLTGTGNLAIGYPRANGVLNTSATNYAMTELSDIDLGDDVTIAFWVKGTAAEGVNTHILEAYDVNNNRVLNIHMPWSNNRVFWDAGSGTSYDRIDKAIVPGDIDNNWNHWAFTKDATTGDMQIYMNGTLWHSETGMNTTLGEIHRMVIGANKNLGNLWNGKIDEFQVWNTALDQPTISAWYQQTITNAHPNYNDLLVYYDFDDVAYAKDKSANDNLLMPSEKGMFDFSELPVVGSELMSYRPNISFGIGTVAGPLVIDTNFYYTALEPSVFFEQQATSNKFIFSNSFLGLEEGVQEHYHIDGSVVSSTNIGTTSTISNSDILYFEEPFEIVNDIEIGRFITPYGINFDLGPNGFTWVYDITDYQQFLKGAVDLAAHNTQELIDVKFVFIEGIPPRDVHNVETVFGKWGSHTYNDLDNDVKLPATDVQLSDTSSNFRLKSRITGHGHNGSTQCCEWDPKGHEILVDGTSRFNWSIWHGSECGDNPNISQGGTWPYAREGWCPGDLVKDVDHELTPYVTPGTTVSIDYDIEDVPSNDAAQGNGNYVIATHLVSYGAPNFQNDAAIIDVLNPNDWEYYSKWNPTCSNPRVILQNTGEQALTSARIKIWISAAYGIEYEWTGNLEFLGKEVVEIPVNDNSWWADFHGLQTFHAEVVAINGDAGLDEYAQNNMYTTKFEAPESIFDPFYVWFKTNNKANENYYKLVDHNGDIIFDRDNLANTTEYKDTFDLAPGCYSIIVEDSDSDGLGFWYSAQVEGETNGFFRLRKVGGSYIEIFPTDFGNYHRYDFSVDFGLSLDEAEKLATFDIYPNPTIGQLNLELSGDFGDADEVEIYDRVGARVGTFSLNNATNFATAQIDVSKLQSGMYFARIVTSKGVYTKEFIKK